MRSVTLVAAAAAACATTASLPSPAAAPAPALFAPSAAAMDAHLKYLADGLLEGRAPATRGGRLAVRYVAAQFEAIGLEPGAADGSYFQPVALVGMTAHPPLVWRRGGAPHALKYLDDLVAWAERPESHIVADGDGGFVGYGIQAAEWRWDDYKDTDVRGKVLLMIVIYPGLRYSSLLQGRCWSN